MNKRPQTYNEWVEVIENNGPGVVAQLVVDEIERAEEEENERELEGQRGWK